MLLLIDVFDGRAVMVIWFSRNSAFRICLLNQTPTQHQNVLRSSINSSRPSYSKSCRCTQTLCFFLWNVSFLSGYASNCLLWTKPPHARCSNSSTVIGPSDKDVFDRKVEVHYCIKQKGQVYRNNTTHKNTISEHIYKHTLPDIFLFDIFLCF